MDVLSGVLLGLGLSALGLWRNQMMFVLASSAVFLFVGLQAESGLILIAMVGLAIGQIFYCYTRNKG